MILSRERLIAQIKAHPARLVAVGCVGIAVFCLVHLLTHTHPRDLHRLWERHAALKPAKLEDYINYGMWIGAAAGLGISLFLAATAFLWSRPPTSHRVKLGSPEKSPARNFWLLVGAIVLVAGAIRAPRMDDSFWGDEAWAYTDLIGGRYTQNADGSLDYKPHSWEMTFFWDKGLNNQYFFTVLARLSNETWQKLNNKPEHAFSEAALRMPAFIAGLLSIAVFAGLMRRLGFARAGIALAALLCVNPWHIRYSAEARSYTMLILFLGLLVWFLVNALATDRRRWWALFALAEFGALYSWKAAIHPCAAINLAALLILFLRLKRDALIPASRCIAANSFALLAFVPLFGPGMPQIALSLERGRLVGHGIDMDWIATVWSQILGAMDWFGMQPESPFKTIVTLAADSPLLTYGFVVIIAPAVVLVGIVRLLRVDRATAVLLFAPLLGLALSIAHFTINGTYMHKWYTFYAMPAILVLVACGLTAWRPRSGNPGLIALPTILFIGLQVAVFLPQISALVTKPIAAPRTAAQLTRTAEQGYGSLGPSDHLTVGVYRRVLAYDPRIIQKFEGEHIRSAAVLAKVLRNADAEGKTLDFTISNIDFTRENHSDLFEIVDDERYFEPLGILPAIEAYIRVGIWRYRSGSFPAEP